MSDYVLTLLYYISNASIFVHSKKWLVTYMYADNGPPTQHFPLHFCPARKRNDSEKEKNVSTHNKREQQFWLNFLTEADGRPS